MVGIIVGTWETFEKFNLNIRVNKDLLYFQNNINKNNNKTYMTISFKFGEGGLNNYLKDTRIKM